MLALWIAWLLALPNYVFRVIGEIVHSQFSQSSVGQQGFGTAVDEAYSCHTPSPQILISILRNNLTC